MAEIDLDIAKNFLAGLQGDEAQKKWSIEYLQPLVKYLEKRGNVRIFATEWVNTYVRDRRWDDPDFQHFREECMKDGMSKEDVILDESRNLIEYTKIHWDEEKDLVVRMPFASENPFLSTQEQDEMLDYINKKMKEDAM